MADPSAVVIVVAGQTLTPWARVGRVRIDDVLNDAPNTAALTLVYTPRFGPAVTGAFDPPSFDAAAFDVLTRAPVFGPPPPVAPGAPIQIYLGAPNPAALIFGGQITAREQYAEFDQPQHVRLDLSCVDFTRRLNRRKVVREYGQASATAIVLDLIATYAPGITVGHVMAGLPTITGGITFTFEDVSRALSRVAEKIGAYWYVDYVGDLHFFTGTEAGTEPAPIVPGADFAALKIAADLSQVRTRVIVEAEGATVIATLPAGDGIVPVSVAAPFNAAGGQAKIGPTRVTYTGIHPGGVTINTVGSGTGGTAPPATPTAPAAAVAAATVGALAGGPYRYAVTVELSDGSRSDLGSPSGPVTIAGATAPAATAAALPNAPIRGPVQVGIASDYASTFVAANGGETVPTFGGVGLSIVTGRAVTPSPNTVGGFSPQGGGGIVPGFYHYAITFLTPGGETTASPSAEVSIPGGFSAVHIASIPIPVPTDARVTGRRLYRSSVSASSSAPVLPWRHVIDIPGVSGAAVFVDTNPDQSLAPRQLPAGNSATDLGEGATLTLPISSDPRVVRRRVYRKDGAGPYRLIVEIPDNTTITYIDVGTGSGAALAPTASTLASGAVSLTAIPLGPAGTVRRRIFRTTANGTQYRELTALENNTATTHTDTESDQTLGGSPLPAQGGAGAGAPPTGIGSPTLRVSSLAGLPAAGWVAVEAQIVRYTATSTAGGNFLTGIPASGPGAITADVPAGTVVTTSPAITGVAPIVAVTLGDPVNVIAQVDDAGAQAAIAAIEGGDGVIEHYIQDRRLTEAAARARGLAELALFKQIETHVTYTTHDPQTRSGRTVHIDLPAPTSLTGDFLIQRVTLDDVSIAAQWYPKRTVDASTTRFSFEDVLSRLLMESA